MPRHVPCASRSYSGNGLLGDDLTPDEQNSIRAARERFENRRRTKYNEALFSGEQALMHQVQHGELTPTQAVEKYAVLLAEHGINMRSAEAGEIYSAATTGQQTARLTRGALLEAACNRVQQSWVTP